MLTTHPRTRPLAALFVLAALAACHPSDRSGSDERAETLAPPVEALQARSGALPLEERLHGVVKAKNQVEVRAEISARVLAVLVASGEAVDRGQPLVRLDDATASQQLRQTEASLRLAEASARAARARVAELEAQVVRSRSLAAQALVSVLELETQEARLAATEANAEEAEARVDAARASVEEHRTALTKTVVRSPVAGHVGQRRAEIGMLVGPDTLLYQVGNLDQVIVEIPLTERMLGHLRAGQTVLVTPRNSSGEPLRATLARISPFLEDGSFSTLGEIDIDNREGRLHPGMFVTVDVLYGESERATLVPASALWDDPRTGALGVFVVAEMSADPKPVLSERAHPVALRPVEVLAEGRAAIGVRGVEPGEWVVSVGQHLLAGGESATARVRPTTWERVLELQGLQREDLLRGFLEKQQALAQTRGAALPTNEEFLRPSVHSN